MESYKENNTAKTTKVEQKLCFPGIAILAYSLQQQRSVHLRRNDEL
jgi:hypothetical protein